MPFTWNGCTGPQPTIIIAIIRCIRTADNGRCHMFNLHHILFVCSLFSVSSLLVSLSPWKATKEKNHYNHPSAALAAAVAAHGETVTNGSKQWIHHILIHIDTPLIHVQCRFSFWSLLPIFAFATHNSTNYCCALTHSLSHAHIHRTQSHKHERNCHDDEDDDERRYDADSYTRYTYSV